MKTIDRIKDIKSVLGPQIELLKFQREWRESNQHNNTRVGRLFPKEKVHVGKYTYGTLNVVSYGNERERLEIGNYCSIAGDTVFILSGEHDYRRISTFPFSRVALHRVPESITKGPIIIEDDVWIGYGCLFLSGIKVGRGAVIGAGSIVNKNIPPYAIFAGGRIIKYRFSQDVIKKLVDNPLPELSEKKIAEMLDLLECPITDTNIDDILCMINK